jgi:hypothetical protein
VLNIVLLHALIQKRKQRSAVLLTMHAKEASSRSEWHACEFVQKSDFLSPNSRREYTLIACAVQAGRTKKCQIGTTLTQTHTLTYTHVSQSSISTSITSNCICTSIDDHPSAAAPRLHLAPDVRLTRSNIHSFPRGPHQPLHCDLFYYWGTDVVKDAI